LQCRSFGCDRVRRSEPLILSRSMGRKRNDRACDRSGLICPVRCGAFRPFEVRSACAKQMCECECVRALCAVRVVCLQSALPPPSLSASLSVCWSVCLFVSFCLSVCPSVCQSVGRCACLSPVCWGMESCAAECLDVERALSVQIVRRGPSPFAS